MINTIDKKIIIEIYNRNKEGEPLKKLREEFNITEGQFRHGRNRLNLPALNKKNRIKLNENLFKIIDNELKAYYLGLIAADGCVMKEGNSFCISLSLKKSDIYILEPLRDALCPDRQFYKFNSKQPSLVIRSVNLGKDLINLNIIPRKSYELGLDVPLNLNKDLMPHFIRGYFDGDGHICIQRKYTCKMGFVCKFPQILESIQKEIHNNIVLDFHSNLYKDNYDRYYLETSSQIGTLLLGAYLYKNATYYLKRKYNKWNSVASAFLNKEIKARPYGYDNSVLRNILINISSVESRY